ncbi:MAG: hypothetical protein IT454_18570 [Planctomycetes bacterium]|nr:hypothetical protein [Planctomycetota bacterium]
MPITPVAFLVALAVQDPTPQLPIEADFEQDGLQLDLDQVKSWNIDVHALLKTSYMVSPDKDVDGVSYDTARAWINGTIADWRFHFGMRADVGRRLGSGLTPPDPSGDGLGFFGVPKRLGDARANEVWVQTELVEGLDWLDTLDLRVGRFKPPMMASSMFPETGLLMYSRSFIGNDWDYYQDGVMLRARTKRVRAWLSAQNGADRMDQDMGLTARGVVDLFGDGVNYNYEGAYRAEKKLAVSAGGAMHYDTSTSDRSAQGVDVRMTGGELFGLGPFSLAAEYVDNGDGLGHLYSYGVMASFMLTDDIECAASFEDFQDFDRVIGADLLRGSISYYIAGHDVKLQLAYASADSNAPLVDDETWVFGLNFGI